MLLEELRRKMIEEKYLKNWLVGPNGSWVWNEDGSVSIRTDHFVSTDMVEHINNGGLPFKIKEVRDLNGKQIEKLTATSIIPICKIVKL